MLIYIHSVKSRTEQNEYGTKITNGKKMLINSIKKLINNSPILINVIEFNQLLLLYLNALTTIFIRRLKC